MKDSKFSVSPPLLSTGHMAINADLLAPGSSVFYLRGTTGERVPATVVGLSSFPECVAISLVMTQVIRLAPRALTIFARTMHTPPPPLRMHGLV